MSLRNFTGILTEQFEKNVRGQPNFTFHFQIVLITKKTDDTPACVSPIHLRNLHVTVALQV